jgi:hypothetical protein
VRRATTTQVGTSNFFAGRLMDGFVTRHPMTQEQRFTDIDAVEAEIDLAFAANPLLDAGYAQAVWTLLSQNEDAYMRAVHELSDPVSLELFTDLRLNALTYPLRVCYLKAPTAHNKLATDLKDGDYKAARDWLEQACHGYYSFCAIFPLWRRKLLNIDILGDDRITASYVVPRDRAYEVYNRLLTKEARHESKEPIPTERIAEEVMANTTRGVDWFRINFSPPLVAKLVAGIEPLMGPRHLLPSGWAFDGFTLGDFKRIFITVQAMLWGWMIARNVVAASGMPGMGYRSSVWVVSHDELRARLRRYTDVGASVIERVITLLTFGACDVRDPDIAIQPLIDLRNGSYALSPFVWLNTHAERNLCVLLNQIPTQREIYERVKNEKESMLNEELEEFLLPLGLYSRSGEVDGTDVDIAIIDRAARICLCLELKWFIEPAEVREGQERTKELRRGIQQARKIWNLYLSADERLLSDILQIDSSYRFAVAVASVNWIGHADAQDSDVPIVKVWHLMRRISDTRSLEGVLDWLANREYLPREGSDFEIQPVDIQCGKWSCEWYVIKPLGASPTGPAA